MNSAQRLWKGLKELGAAIVLVVVAIPVIALLVVLWVAVMAAAVVLMLAAVAYLPFQGGEGLKITVKDTNTGLTREVGLDEFKKGDW
jgi:hypothetical protein